MQTRVWSGALAALLIAAVLSWGVLGQAQAQGVKPPEAKQFATTPVNLNKIKKEDLDKQILRAAIIAELDAVSFYEQLAGMTEDEKLKAILLDVAKEEKTHVGEFQAMLLRLDPEQKAELAHGEKEVEELINKKK